MDGGRTSYSTREQNQTLTERCGTEGAVEAKIEFSAPPAPSRVSPFITDDELRARYGDDAELLIDALDRDPRTQRGQSGKPPEARDRAVVEEIIRARGLAV